MYISYSYRFRNRHPEKIKKKKENLALWFSKNSKLHFGTLTQFERNPSGQQIGRLTRRG